MSKKIVLYKSLVIGVIVLFIGVAIQPAIADSPNSSDNETYLEITAKVFGRWRVYFIITIIKNIGDEKVKFVHCSPGGGFEIHNSDKRVYWSPKIPIRIEIGRTLYPGQLAIMYWSFWTGFDDFGRTLPNGDYYVRGFVWTYEFGTLYGENVSIFLGKSLNN